ERRKTHGERREEQERQLDARRQLLRVTLVRTVDEYEEAGQGDDREDGVSQLAAKPDRVDDLLEKLFSVAEQCFQEGGIARDPLIGGHGQALGVRASNLATILLFCQCLLMFDNVYNLNLRLPNYRREIRRQCRGDPRRRGLVHPPLLRQLERGPPQDSIQRGIVLRERLDVATDRGCVPPRHRARECGQRPESS